jgi:demethylmenaquinone methyltransferase/2-methoxy-6-polyprenyl-1,4-benzoquinol methylase
MYHTLKTTVPGYENAYVPRIFDALIATIFAPFGGVRRLRSAAIDLLALSPGTRVLEPGCGTGGVTKLLLERGANVLAIDGSAHMLERAKRRAPGARFEQQQLEALVLNESFDVVLFSFVLHELPRELRARALASVVAALTLHGRVAVLDHAVPKRGLFARAWRTFLLKLEPPTVAECIATGFEDELAAAGLDVVARHELAGGTVRLTIARRKLG